MLRSMTAFARASSESSLGRFSVEIQSVNRKHLEVGVLLPKELSRFESEIRKRLVPHLFRGQINVKLFATFESETPVTVSPNLPLARQMKKAWDKIAEELGVEGDKGFQLEMLSDVNGILLYDENLKDEALYLESIFLALDKALALFVEMKLCEGAELQKDLGNRLVNLRQWIDQITLQTAGATSKYRQKLIERLEEVVPSCVENEERILREVCLYADRIDITEEITRFNSHLGQVENLLQVNECSVAKKFEFLIQELNREINTIGSKSADIEIARLVIEVKSELERIREQIQNVE